VDGGELTKILEKKWGRCGQGQTFLRGKTTRLTEVLQSKEKNKPKKVTIPRNREHTPASGEKMKKKSRFQN